MKTLERVAKILNFLNFFTKMKISKEELKVIYEKERGRVTLKQIDRFKDEEYGQSAFHTYVDGEKTDVIYCILCSNDPAKNRTMFFMTNQGLH